jgi:hypothetical protein
LCSSLRNFPIIGKTIWSYIEIRGESPHFYLNYLAFIVVLEIFGPSSLLLSLFSLIIGIHKTNEKKFYCQNNVTVLGVGVNSPKVARKIMSCFLLPYPFLKHELTVNISSSDLLISILISSLSLAIAYIQRVFFLVSPKSLSLSDYLSDFKYCYPTKLSAFLAQKSFDTLKTFYNIEGRNLFITFTNHNIKKNAFPPEGFC